MDKIQELRELQKRLILLKLRRKTVDIMKQIREIKKAIVLIKSGN